MAKRTQLGAILVTGLLAACSVGVCGAQTAPAANSGSNPAPCSVDPQPEPCGTKPASAAKPDTMEKFPFPGEPANNSAAPDLSGVPQAPSAPDTTSSPAPTPAPAAKKGAQEFPFPGEPVAGSGVGAANSSSSSTSDDASPLDPGNPDATPALKDQGSEGSQAEPGRHLLHRVNPIGTKLQSSDEREAEDLSVAHFYTESGDLPGAYLRSQDAVKTAPEDPDAHFALAEIALKLNKRDQAIAEYNACLKLGPSSKEIKESRKALERLASEAKLK